MKNAIRKCTLIFALVICISVMMSAAAWAGVYVNSRNFPDANFRSYISTYIDIDHNGYLSDSEISNVTLLTLRNKGIKSLSGIKYFKKLRTLNVSNTSSVYYGSNENVINTLDVSNMTSLQVLGAEGVYMSSLNVKGCTSLWKISCSSNNLASLNVASCTALKELNCGSNLIKGTLSLSNEKLETVNCSGNQITTLTIGSSKLNALYCENNKIVKLSATVAYPQTLYCQGNKLAYLNLGSNSNLFPTTNSSRLTNLKFGAYNSEIYNGIASNRIQEASSAKVANMSRREISKYNYNYDFKINIGTITGSRNKSQVHSVYGYRNPSLQYAGTLEVGYYDPSTGYAMFKYEPDYVIYYYKTGYNGKIMPVLVPINGAKVGYYTYYTAAKPNIRSLPYIAPASYSYVYVANDVSSSSGKVKLTVVGDNVLSVGTERDEGIINVKAGDLTFRLQKFDGSEIIYVNDASVENVTFEDDGTFTLPAELVHDGISVQVNGDWGVSDILNINVIE